MAKFLTGEPLSEKIRDVLQGEEVRCAVAFWGAGAVEELFGEEVLNRDDVWIVCDISMGGTNPDTLRNLGAPENESLGHIEGLHAKLYHSSAGMVVGSANASSNGIGFMGKAAGLTESGVFVGPDKSSWNAAKTWFDDEVWFNAEDLDNAALERAQTHWENRANAAKRAYPPAWGQRPSFLEVLRHEPALFGDIEFVFTTEPFSAEEKDENIKAAIEGGEDEVRATGAVQFGCFGKEVVNDWPLRFIEFSRRWGKISVNFYTRGFMSEGIHFANKSSLIGPDFADIRKQMVFRAERVEEAINGGGELFGKIFEEDEPIIWSASDLNNTLFHHG